MIGCALVPTVLILVIVNMMEKSGIAIQEDQLPSLIMNFNIALPLILIVLMYISYHISFAIYKKKEW